MRKFLLAAGALVALLTVGAAAPATAQTICQGGLGNVLCSAGIGAGIGSAIGGQKGAQIGLGVGAVGGLLTAPQYNNPPPPTYYSPPPPPPTYYVQPAPVYAAPNWCSSTVDSYGNYCNVYSCAKACNGGQSGFNSFRASDCSYNPGGGYGRRRCTY